MASGLPVLCFILLRIPFNDALSQAEINDIKTGIKFATELTDAMDSAGFGNLLGGFGSKAFAFISGTLKFVNAIFSFLGQNESPELLAIKRLYNTMNRRFDSLDLQLVNIKRQINWSQVKLQYSQIERNIISNSKMFNNIYESPIANKHSEMDYFMHAFENSCYLCAINLYHGIMGENSGFSDDILNVAMTSLKYNRPRTQSFMLGLLKLLTLGINNELAYRQMKYGEASVPFIEQQWKERLPHVLNKMKLINEQIKNKSHSQAEKDIAELSIQNTVNARSHKNFSEYLYNFLVQKYDWRDWLVIVYRPISTVENHINHVCEGYRRYGMYGRDVLVASVDKTKTPINITKAKGIISSVTTTFGFMLHQEYQYVKMYAGMIYEKLPSETKNCSTYGSVGVIDSWVDLHYQGLNTRLAHKRTPGSNSYSIHLFG